MYIVVEQWRRKGGIKCELSGGGSPRHLNTFSNLVYDCCPLHTYQYMLCIVAIVHCIHIVSAITTVSFGDLVTLHRSTLQDFDDRGSLTRRKNYTDQIDK